MSLCVCLSCSSGTTKGGDWSQSSFLCASFDPYAATDQDTQGSWNDPTSGPLPANTALATGIGTTGNFVNQDIHGLLSGTAWSGTTVTFSFPTSAAFYGATYTDPAASNGFQPLSTAQQSVARYAFDLISRSSGLNFVEITETMSTHATIRLAGSSYPSTSYAYLPGPFSRDGDIWFGNIRNTEPTKGSYAYSTFLHEIGHAIGLKHGQSATGSMAVFGVLPAEHNSTEWSVMTYMSYIGAAGTAYENAPGSGNQTYMINDIAAMQHMYGANFNTNAGNTVYTWSPTTGEMFIDGVGQGAATTNTAYAAIWDGNGTDTYDLSNYTTNLSLDLRPGEWSIFDTTQLARLGGGNLAHGNVANAHRWLNSDNRSLIENAIGGNGDDTVVGNDGANALWGGAGDDILFGLLGDDTLHGGEGIDTAMFSGAAKDYAITSLGGGSFQVAGPDGTKSLHDIEYLQFGDAAPLALAVAAAACFVAGTRITTLGGEREVQALRVGDLVATQGGQPRPIRWIGRRHYPAALVAANPQLQPVRIRAGALAAGVPRHDLLLSPQHAVWVAPGLLVPAAALANGCSIVHEPARDVTYLHIELERHELILAEGAPVESFVDEDSRALFDNAADYRTLYPGARPAPPPMPRTEGGFALEAARRALAERAGLQPRGATPGALQGHVERIAGGFIEGWVLDTANPAEPVELRMLTGLGPRRVIANRYRGDLQRAGIGTFRHGFREPVGMRPKGIAFIRPGDGACLPWATA